MIVQKQREPLESYTQYKLIGAQEGQIARVVKLLDEFLKTTSSDLSTQFSKFIKKASNSVPGTVKEVFSLLSDEVVFSVEGNFFTSVSSLSQFMLANGFVLSLQKGDEQILYRISKIDDSSLQSHEYRGKKFYTGDIKYIYGNLKTQLGVAIENFALIDKEAIRKESMEEFQELSNEFPCETCLKRYLDKNNYTSIKYADEIRARIFLSEEMQHIKDKIIVTASLNKNYISTIEAYEGIANKKGEFYASYKDIKSKSLQGADFLALVNFELAGKLGGLIDCMQQAIDSKLDSKALIMFYDYMVNIETGMLIRENFNKISLPPESKVYLDRDCLMDFKLNNHNVDRTSIENPKEALSILKKIYNQEFMEPT